MNQQNTNILEINAQHFPLIFRLVSQIGTPISILDIETTTHVINSPAFGITQLAYVAFMPDGKVRSFDVLINPEKPITAQARQTTKIDDDMVRSMPNIAAHAKRIKGIIEQTVMCGFNSNTFDVPALLSQLDQYKISIDSNKANVLDIKNIWNAQHKNTTGTLSDLSTFYGAPLDKDERAKAGVVACCYILEKMLWKHGSDLVQGLIKPCNQILLDNQQTPYSNPNESVAVQKLRSILNTAISSDFNYIEFQKFLQNNNVLINVSTYGASYLIDGKKIKGSELGTEYTWRNISSKIPGSENAQNGSGNFIKSKINEEQRIAPTSRHSNSASSSVASTATNNSALSNENRTEQKSTMHNSAPNAPLNIVANTENVQITTDVSQPIKGETLRSFIQNYLQHNPLDIEDLAQKTQNRTSTLTFAISDLLEKKEISPQNCANANIQNWLKTNWQQIRSASPPERTLLKPMMEQAQKLNPPDGLDYIQLRCALLFSLEKTYEQQNSNAQLNSHKNANANAEDKQASASEPKSSANFTTNNNVSESSAQAQEPTPAKSSHSQQQVIQKTIFPIGGASDNDLMSTSSNNNPGSAPLFDDEPAPFGEPFDFSIPTTPGTPKL